MNTEAYFLYLRPRTNF